MTREEELIILVRAYVERGYDGNYRACFRMYDVDSDDKVSATELEYLLHDAEVGNRLTRAAWVRGVIDRLDTDKDGKISWDEFQSALKPQ